MRFSYQWLRELTGTRASPRELAELLTLHSFEVEVAGKVGGDWALEAKIPTNRISDAASHRGLAREIAAITARPARLPPAARAGPAKPAGNPEPVRISIARPALCPRYSAQALEIGKLARSPKWMRGRLLTCGFRPLNNVVDVTNYVMLETGQPLHAFDLDRIRGATMEIRESRRGEALTTLDGTSHTLPKGTLVIADRERLIDLAGIMGGENSAVTARSRRILLQAAVFDPVRIYRAIRTLGFASAAAKIYSAGIDPNRTTVALERAAGLLGGISAAREIGGAIDIYPRRVAPQKLLLRREQANRIIGEEIGRQFYRTTWRRLGFRAREERGGWLVEVPSERRDIQIAEDLIEEVVRLWGYGKLRARSPETRLAPSFRNEELEWEERVRDVLVGTGETEVHAYRFAARTLLDAFGSSTQDLLEIANPTSPDTQYLAGHPALRYLAIAAENLRHCDAVGIFGVAKGFKRRARPTRETPADEKKYVVMVQAAKEPKAAKGTKGDGAEAFYEAKGIIDHLLESLGVAEHWYDDALTKDERRKTKALHPYRTAKVMVGDEFLGIVAELHPAVAERLKARGARLVFAELSFEKLWKLARAEVEFKPIGRYPAVVRDIAVLVPAEAKADDVEGVIQNAGGKLLADTDLFDYFQDEAMGERGEKSLAFHLVFQSAERTLTDEEVNRLYQKITSALKGKGWEIRG